MKGSMKARLVDCRISHDNVEIDVINLKSNKNKVETFTGIASNGVVVKKLHMLANSLSEDNDIVLTLSLINDLTIVDDITGATVNGIDVNLDEVNIEEARKAEARELECKEDNKNMFLIKIFLVISILFVLTMIFTSGT